MRPEDMTPAELAAANKRVNDATQHLYEAAVAAAEPRGNFQKLVARVRGKNQCGCDAPCRCGEGTKPWLTFSTIYHNARLADFWTEAQPGRVAVRRRLVAQHVPSDQANDLSWRWLEDAMYSADGPDGFDLKVLELEFKGMVAFGEGTEYPAKPSEEEIAAALADKGLLFPEGGIASHGGYVRRLPTTIMWICKRLGVWSDVELLLNATDEDQGELGYHSTSSAWSFVEVMLNHKTAEEIAAAIRGHLTRVLKGQREVAGRV